MRIATMATGGIGGYLAVKLTNAGHDVATIARGDHLQAIRENGLTLESSTGTEHCQPWMATDDPSDVGAVDAIIFGVKGDDLETAAKACLPMIGPDTIVIPFLNGVEASDRMTGILPDGTVGNGVAKVSTTISAPGVIKQTGEFSDFVFAERDSRPSKRIAALQAAIRDAGPSATPTDDIERELWWKFILFSGVSGVTAAARCTFRDIATVPRLGALFRQVVAETAAIARMAGIRIESDVEQRIWETVQGLPPNGRASTAVDLEKGLPLEIEWVSGAAVRLAEKYGVAAPMNNALYALLLPHRNGR